MHSKFGNFIVLKDFNDHVRSSTDEYEGVHGGMDRKSKIGMAKDSWSSQIALRWCFFKKDLEKLITSKSGCNSSAFDYVMVK